MMIHITLPDGSLREYDQPLSVFEVAASIGIGLAKAAVAGRVNGTLVDCAFVISQDARVNIVTPREPEGLEILRRSCALLLAMAIRQLYAEAILYAGVVVGDGFYCEFAHEQSLRPDDLKLIEARMYALAATNHSINHVRLRSRLEAFEDVGDGPHIPSTKVLQAFTLTHLCGTSRQRIYGVCWANQQELDEWRAPQQVVVVNIDERQLGYAQSVTEALRRAGFRANSDVRKQNIGNKIRHHTLQAVPYLLVIGDKEMNGGFVSLRSGKGEDLGQMSIEAVCERLRIEVDAIAGKAAALPAIEIRREV